LETCTYHLKRELAALIALLAGTGLRIGEALALMVGPDNGQDSYWDPLAGTLTVRTTMVDGKIQPDPKTKAGKRTVDLEPGLNAFLCLVLESRAGRIFQSSEDTYRRRLSALGILGFHSLRRFRITHLQSKNVPTTLTKFWAGHAAGDITERYTKVGSQIDERKNWSERAGLGFQL
jgi:integrase